MDNSFITMISDALRLVPEVREHLGVKALILLARAETKSLGDLSLIMTRYHDDITQALIDYIEKSGSIRPALNAFKRAVVQSFGPAFDRGYTDGGGELPLALDANDWLNARVDEEFGHVEMLFQQARELRKEEEFRGQGFSWALARADGYTHTLQSIYGAGKMWAHKYKMLTWQYGETEHCETCLSLNGQRHQARWYINRDYIPRKPGAAMECGGFQCQCSLLDDDGAEFTIGEGKALKAGFDPNQPRDEHGQWAETGAVVVGREENESNADNLEGVADVNQAVEIIKMQAYGAPPEHIRDYLSDQDIEYVYGYHVTNSSNAEKIIKNGIGLSYQENRPDATYFFLDKRDVLDNRDVLGYGSNSIVIKIKIPANEAMYIRDDSLFNGTFSGSYSAARLLKPIPSKWIYRVERLD